MTSTALDPRRYSAAPKFWVRANSPFKHMQPLVDLVVYACPVRMSLSIAVLDVHNQFWTAPSWFHGGVCWVEKVDGAPIEFQLWPRFHVPEMVEEFEPLMFSVNGGDALVFGADNGPAAYVSNFVLNSGPDRMDYSNARKEWDRLFEQVHPRPRRSLLSAHDISIRAARYTHVKRCKALLRKLEMQAVEQEARRRYESALTAEEENARLERQERLREFSARDIMRSMD